MRTTRALVEELRRVEFEEDFVSPVSAAASRHALYHLFWDDIDKPKLTDFKTEVLFDLVDSLYRQKHGLTRNQQSAKLKGNDARCFQFAPFAAS